VKYRLHFLSVLTTLSVIAVFVFAFYGIRSRSMWLDEAYTVLVSNRPFSDVINEVKYDSAPPLYYLLLSFWVRIFGISEGAVRSLSGLFYIANVFVMYRLGRQLSFHRYVGYVSAFLFLVSPLAIRHAQNSRMYTLLSLLVSLSLLFFFKIISGDKRSKTLITYILVNVAGSFTHYWFLFPLFGQGLAVTILHFRRHFFRFVALITVSVIPFLVLWMPVVLGQQERCGTTWIQKPEFEVIWATIVDFYGRERIGPWVIVVFVALMFTTVQAPRTWSIKASFKSLTAQFSKLKNQVVSRNSLILIIVIVCSFLVPFVVSHIVQPIFVMGRYTIAVLPVFALLLALLLSELADQKLLFICFCFLLAGAQVSLIKSRNEQISYTDRNTAKYLVEHGRKGDVILYTGLSHAGIEYYLALFEKGSFFKRLSYPKELMQHMGWRDIPKMLAEKDELQKEALATARELQSVMGKDAKIWLLYGTDVEVSEPIKVELNSVFRLKEVLDVAGPFHKNIFVFQT